MSRSLTESASRRAEPAISTRRRPGARAAPRRSARPTRARATAGCAAPAARRRLGQRGEQRLLELGAEARAGRAAAALGRLAQRVERVDAELVVQPRARFGPKPGRRMTDEQAGGELRAQLARRPGCRPCRPAPGSSPRASCRSPGARHAALAGQLGDRDRSRRARPSRRCGRRDAVGDRAVELVEVGELVEGVGDRGVGRSATALRYRRPPRSRRPGSRPHSRSSGRELPKPEV